MTTQSYKNRILGIFLAFVGAYILIIINLYFIQVLHRSFFVQLGEKQYGGTFTAYPPRAPIIDRTGKIYLALNKDSVAAFLTPRTLEEPEKVDLFLKKYFPTAATRLKQQKNSHFMYIKRRLTPDQINLIKHSKLTDIKLLNEPSRYYPLEAAAPVIGITDIDNKGLFGIEMQYNEQLAGTPTTYQLEKDARSGHFYFKKEALISGHDSQPLQLTLDSKLQFLAYEELKDTVTKFNAKEAAIIVMDPNNGDIIVMAHYPAFNPNDTATLDLALTKNTVVTEAYELGSVIKICAALAALEEGIVTPDELIDCKNAETAIIDGRVINTWRAHGIIPFEEVIAYSNNIGIAQVAKRVDKKLYIHYRNMGLGQKTGLAFPGEAKGYLNPPEKWSKQSIISLSYGYEVAANLLQLARFFAMLARNGTWVEPRLIMSAPINVSSRQVFSEEAVATIQHMLEKTAEEGTARKAAIKGYRVMSKTGTANLLDNGRYNPDRNIFTCAGIVQKDSYQRVIVAFVKEVSQKDLYASTVAAPLFEHIAEKVLIHDKII